MGKTLAMELYQALQSNNAFYKMLVRIV